MRYASTRPRASLSRWKTWRNTSSGSPLARSRPGPSPARQRARRFEPLAILRFTPAALRDLERLAVFLRESNAEEAAKTIPVILDGLKVLATHPLIGRPLDETRRELLVFRGRSGY